MKNGCILNGGVGSGKSLTALAYYFFKECGGSQHWQGDYIPMTHPKDLYIITDSCVRYASSAGGNVVGYTLNQIFSISSTKIPKSEFLLYFPTILQLVVLLPL